MQRGRGDTLSLIDNVSKIDTLIFENMLFYVKSDEQKAVEICWDRLVSEYLTDRPNSTTPYDIADWLLLSSVSEFMEEMRKPFMKADKEERMKFIIAWSSGTHNMHTEYEEFLKEIEGKGTFNIDAVHEIAMRWFEPARDIFKYKK